MLRALRLVAAGLAVLALGACAPLPMAETSSITGPLSRKGSPPGVFWAVIDAQGKTWRLLTTQAAQQDQLKALQGHEVRLQGRPSADPAGDEWQVEQVREAVR